MGFDFDKLKGNIVSVGKDVGNKVNDVSAVAKVKLDIRSKENYIEKQYTELGRAYYLAHKEEEDVPEKEFFKPIEEAEEEIKRLNEKLLNLQGAKICPNCGARQSKAHAFCDSCGATIDG